MFQRLVKFVSYWIDSNLFVVVKYLADIHKESIRFYIQFDQKMQFTFFWCLPQNTWSWSKTKYQNVLNKKCIFLKIKAKDRFWNQFITKIENITQLTVSFLFFQNVNFILVWNWKWLMFFLDNIKTDFSFSIYFFVWKTICSHMFQ